MTEWEERRVRCVDTFHKASDRAPSLREVAKLCHWGVGTTRKFVLAACEHELLEFSGAGSLRLRHDVICAPSGIYQLRKPSYDPARQRI